MTWQTVGAILVAVVGEGESGGTHPGGGCILTTRNLRLNRFDAGEALIGGAKDVG